jgi:hypothetical protein
MNITATALADWLLANPLLGFFLIVWTFAWKGFALWKAAGLRQRNWFIAMLVLNTVGILEIIYIYFIARKYKVEVVQK